MNKDNETFKVFAKIITETKMKIRMFFILALTVFFFQIFLNILHFIQLDSPIPEAKLIYFKTLAVGTLNNVPMISELKLFRIGSHSVDSKQFSQHYQALLDFYNIYIVHFFKRSLLAWITLPFLYLYFFLKSRSVFQEKYIRGTMIIPEKEFARKIKKEKNSIVLNSSLSIPFDCENRHVFAIGRPGSGKTQFFCRVIEKIIERNDKAIVYDFKGDFVSRFYNPGTDLIFNPLDQRSVGWRLFNEIQSLANIESICTSLIPPSTRPDTFWENAARDVLFSVLLYCFKNGLTKNEDIYQVSIQSREMLLEKFGQTPGCERGSRPLEESRVGSSVLSTFAQYVKFLEYTRNLDGDFSIRSWVDEENQRGRIFVTNYAEIGPVMQPLVSLFIDTFANRILMLPERIERRIFLFLDEFGTLQRLNNILNLLKLARSYGGSIWIGVQDLGQVENVYGRESAKTIVNSCGNSLIFAVDEPKTADELSRKIGQRERSKIDSNFSFGVKEHKDGHSIAERNMVENAVLPADIMGLEDLSFYFKIAKLREFTQSKLQYKDFPAKNKSFIEITSPPENPPPQPTTKKILHTPISSSEGEKDLFTV